MVRIAGFQPDNLGSIPRWGIFFIFNSNAKSFAQCDNKGISLIKKFIRIMYMKLGIALKDATK